MMTHDEIVTRCLEIDAMAAAGPVIVHYLTADRHTFRLMRAAVYWCSLAENERYCMVKYDNYFLDEAAAAAAVDRALKK